MSLRQPFVGFLSAGLLLVGFACKESPKPAPELKSAVEASGPKWEEAIQVQMVHDPHRQAVVAEVEIAEGFHAYSLGETIGKPLRLRLAEDSPIQPAGEVKYPPGETKMLPEGKSVVVTGQVEVIAPIQATEKGTEAQGDFRYQVCTDSACDRPRTIPFKVKIDG